MFNDNEIYTSLMSGGDPRMFDSNGTIARQYDMVVYPKGDPGDNWLPTINNNGDISFINDRTGEIYKVLVEGVEKTSWPIKGPVTTLEKGTIEASTEGKFDVSITYNGKTTPQGPLAQFNMTYPTSGTSLNGAEEATHNSFYAPSASGTKNQILISQGTNQAPVWKSKADLNLQETISASNSTITIDSNNKIAVNLKNGENELAIKGSATNAYLTTARHIPNIVVVEGDLPAPSEGETWASLGYYEGDLCIQLEPVTTSE